MGLELGRDMDVPLPVTAAAREVLQSHFGAAMLQINPDDYLEKDFAALAETMALAAGMKLESENKNVPTGLGTKKSRRRCARCASAQPNKTMPTEDVGAISIRR